MPADARRYRSFCAFDAPATETYISALSQNIPSPNRSPN